MTDAQEFLLWFIQTTPLIIIGCLAIYMCKCDEQEKKAIVKEKQKNGL